MTEKLWPSLPQSPNKSLINSLVPDSAISWSNELNLLFQQNQLSLKDNAESTNLSLNQLKSQIVSPNQKVKFDNIQMPVSKLFDSCKWLYLNAKSGEKKYNEIIKNWIQISDGAGLFSLKNNLTNIYARSLKRFNDINILISNYNKIWINASNKDPIMRKIFEELVKTKRLIESTLEESKKVFYKIIEWLKTIELLKKIPGLKKDMENSYKQVLIWQKNVNTQKNLDSERINLKKYISQLEDYMSYWTKLSSAIKNTANQPNQPDAKSLNDLIDFYQQKLIQPKKDSLTPPPAPKPQPVLNSATNNNVNVETSWVENNNWNLDNGINWNLEARNSILNRWWSYLNMRRPNGQYFVWPTWWNNLKYRPRSRWAIWIWQCGVWVEMEIRNNPLYKSLMSIAVATTWSYQQKVDAVRACLSPGNKPQIWWVVAINTWFFNWHIWFVHSVNSDWSINVISSNAFWTAQEWNVQQFPSITTYPRYACTHFSKAPSKWR